MVPPAYHRTLEVVLPDVPTGYDSLAQWLHHLSSTTLWDLLRQGDPQRVRELCLALITVLNEVRPLPYYPNVLTNTPPSEVHLHL